jgi:hypothetical protein
MKSASMENASIRGITSSITEVQYKIHHSNHYHEDPTIKYQYPYSLIEIVARHGRLVEKAKSSLHPSLLVVN